MSDNDLIRRGDALDEINLYRSEWTCSREAVEFLPAATPTLADALAVPEVQALVEALLHRRGLYDKWQDRNYADPLGPDGAVTLADAIAVADDAVDSALAPFAKGGDAIARIMADAERRGYESGIDAAALRYRAGSSVDSWDYFAIAEAAILDLKTFKPALIDKEASHDRA